MVMVTLLAVILEMKVIVLFAQEISIITYCFDDFREELGFLGRNTVFSLVGLYV